MPNYFLGREFIVYATLEGTELPVGCARSNSITINNEIIDVASQCSEGWRAIIEGGIRSCTINTSGIASDGTVGLTHSMADVSEAYMNGRIVPVKLVTGSGETISGNFLCTTCERSGEHTDSEMYNCTFENSDEVIIGTPIPDEPPLLDRALWWVNYVESDNLTLSADSITQFTNMVSPFQDMKGGSRNALWGDGSGGFLYMPWLNTAFEPFTDFTTAGPQYTSLQPPYTIGMVFDFNAYAEYSAVSSQFEIFLGDMIKYDPVLDSFLTAISTVDGDLPIGVTPGLGQQYIVLRIDAGLTMTAWHNEQANPNVENITACQNLSTSDYVEGSSQPNLGSLPAKGNAWYDTIFYPEALSDSDCQLLRAYLSQFGGS